jgi:Amidohydrolase family
LFAPELLEPFPEASWLAVDAMCFLPFSSLGDKSMAQVVRFGEKEQKKTEEAAGRPPQGRDGDTTGRARRARLATSNQPTDRRSAMPDFDLIIKGGTIVDGTRTPRYVSDIAVKDGKIARIGGLKGKTASRVLDASGRIVAPGFVDLHTHYDAQIFWDPYCTLSGWHGVTSVALGNCGFGFAPSRVEDRDRAMLSMTRNEAIPYEAMKAGMPWDWVTFPDFIESLNRTPKGVNCLTYVPLTPLSMLG